MAYDSSLQQAQQRIAELEQQVAELQQELERHTSLRQQHQVAVDKLVEKRSLLKEKHLILDAITETLPSPLFFKDNRGIYTGCNQAFCDYLGKRREEIVGHTVYDIAPAELAGVYHRADLELMQHHNTQTYQAQVRYADGRLREILFNKATIGDPDGEVLGLVGVMTDITELNETRQFLAEIINAISDPIFVKDEQHRWQIVNRAFCNFVDRSETELLGKSDYDFFPKEQADTFWRKDQEVFDSEQTNINEERLTVGNRTRHLETKKAFFRSASGDRYLVGIIRDITAIRTTEQEMRSLRNLLRDIIDSMPAALITLDRDGRVSHWNKQAEILTGKTAEQAIGRRVNEALPLLAADLLQVDQALITQQTEKIRKRQRNEQGNLQTLDIMIYPLLGEENAGAVIRIEDVSERIRMEEMMIQSEKMLSLGGLAAGMAHEINNPLAGITQSLAVIESRLLGNLPASRQLAEQLGLDQKALRQYLEQRDIPKLIDRISESSQRAAQTVQSMLSFSRNDRPELLPCDLKEIVKQTLELANKDMAGGYDFRNCRIINQLPNELPPVLGVKSQLQQVFLNLLKNSAQAIFDWCELEAEPQIRIWSTLDKERLVIHLQDNGPGIDEKLRNRIFEPFFTTKDERTGTGLGLSVSYYIITNTHNGTLQVDSAPGHGACFHIGLPLTPPEPMYSI